MKHIICLYIAVTILMSTAKSQKAVDSDINRLFRLFNREFKLSESVISASRDEMMFLLIDLKNNSIDTSYIWQQGSSEAGLVLQSILPKIKLEWQPTKIKSKRIIIPIFIYFSNDYMGRAADIWEIDQLFFSKKSTFSKNSIIVTKRLVFTFGSRKY